MPLYKNIIISTHKAIKTTAKTTSIAIKVPFKCKSSIIPFASSLWFIIAHSKKVPLESYKYTKPTLKTSWVIKKATASKIWTYLFLAKNNTVARTKNKLKAYKLQEEGQDTVEANVSLGFAPDLRNYGVGAQIILDLGFNNFNLITNNPKKIIGLKGYGLTINENINIKSEVNKYNEKYMNTKREKMHHLM